MSGAQSISTRRAYGVQRVCRVWHRARSSVYARRQATRSPALCRRRGPIGAAPDAPCCNAYVASCLLVLAPEILTLGLERSQGVRS